MNWKMLRKVLKWVGIGIDGLLGMIVIALAILYFLGGLKVNKVYDIPAAAITVPTDDARSNKKMTQSDTADTTLRGRWLVAA